MTRHPACTQCPAPGAGYPCDDKCLCWTHSGKSPVLFEILTVFRRINKMAEDIAVQDAKLLRNGEMGLVFIMLQQQDAEIVIAHVRGEVIADNTVDAFVGFYRRLWFAILQWPGRFSPHQYSDPQR